MVGSQLAKKLAKEGHTPKIQSLQICGKLLTSGHDFLRNRYAYMADQQWPLHLAAERSHPRYSYLFTFL